MAEPDPEFPLSKPVIWALCFGATPFAGSILYYVWKSDHPAAAKYANRLSFLSWIVWVIGYSVYAAATKSAAPP